MVLGIRLRDEDDTEHETGWESLSKSGRRSAWLLFNEKKGLTGATMRSCEVGLDAKLLSVKSRHLKYWVDIINSDISSLANCVPTIISVLCGGHEKNSKF